MIAAVESCSFVDFPGRLAAVAFTQGCDLRCRYCHNPELCERKTTNPQIEADFFHLLARRRGLLTGVVICGGEPTLWPKLESFLQRLRSMDLAIKLDTNGLHPERTKDLIEQGLIDYLAVDIKAAPGEPSRWLCGDEQQATSAIQALAQASRWGVACEARTVLVRGVHDTATLSWIAGQIAENGITRWRLTDVRHDRVLDLGVVLTPPETLVTTHALDHAHGLSLDARWSR